MKYKEWTENNDTQLKGRARRLLYEWEKLSAIADRRNDITIEEAKYNFLGLPNKYIVGYDIKSICGVENMEKLNQEGAINKPIFHRGYKMSINIPDNYPDINAPLAFQFLSKDEERKDIPHPWHPNIRFFGDFAGKVCINFTDTYTTIAWAVERVAEYLTYNLYKATETPPYPEDLKVAKWVRQQAEKYKWTQFQQDDYE